MAAQQKFYTVARKLQDDFEVVSYEIVEDILYSTRLDASRAMRAMGGGKDGHDYTLCVYSLYLGGKPNREWEVTVRVVAPSQAEAQRIADGLVNQGVAAAAR